MPPPPSRLARRARVAALALLGAAGACGALSRAAVLERELARDPAPARVERLSGAEPLQPGPWGARLARARSAEEAAALVGQARRFLPDFPPLLLAHLQLLAETEGPAALAAAATAALASPRPPPLVVTLRLALLEAHLQASAPDDALRVAQVLASEGDADPYLLTECFARVALAYELLGRAADADAAFERSLAFGGDGGAALLRLEIERDPSRAAAAGALAARARARHPRQPDLALLAVLERLDEGRTAEAEALLATLPEPLPPRLVTHVGLLGARLAILAGRRAEGWETVRARLQAAPGDAGAVLLALEAHALGGPPDEDELVAILARSRRALRGPPALLERIDALLAASLAAPSGDAPPGDAVLQRSSSAASTAGS